MINLCYQCGEDHPDKIIDPECGLVICPNCGYEQAFSFRPLFLVGGASGVGKSTVCQFLLGKTPDVVLLEGDLLWREEFDRPDTRHRDFFETWLRICKSISISGYSVVLFCAGAAVPENIESCVEHRFFSEVHYLALVCDESELEKRLMLRSDWRGNFDRDFLKNQKQFNQWLYQNARVIKPQVGLVNTTRQSVEETADEVLAWIKLNLSNL